MGSHVPNGYTIECPAKDVPGYSLMESYQKIFAGDLNGGTCDLRHARVQTPSGRTISKCLFCGAIPEIPATQKPIQTLTIYDPTGMIAAQYHSSNADIAAFCTETNLPVFVLCTAGMRCSAGTCVPMLEAVVPVSRETRDAFVLAAADDLIRHLAASPDVTAEQKTQCCAMAEKALSTVQTSTPAPTSASTTAPTPTPTATDQAVLDTAEEVILACCDENGTVTVQELVDTLHGRGIARETTLAVLTTLINDGECYQPKPNIIKRL